MDRIAIHTQMSPEEYLAWEREQSTKHEYVDGKVYAMAGGSPRHNALCAQITSILARERRPGYVVLSSDQRIRLRGKKRYLYPDVSVLCGAAEVESHDVIVNPAILVEVLSKSTAGEDRGIKWESYRRIASLTDYLLVSQAIARIEHFRRAPDGSWIFREAGSGEAITLSNGVTVTVDEVFESAVMSLPGDEPEEE